MEENERKAQGRERRTEKGKERGRGKEGIKERMSGLDLINLILYAS